MREHIRTNKDFCTGCNRCVRECPMEPANVTYQDKDGKIKVKVDHEKCIACGRCVTACQHTARYYTDDTERFFNDLSNGTSISVIAAPAVRVNIPEWKRLFTYLKQAGVKKIYDVSLGADICVWAHIRHIEKNGSAHLITQPCPVVVTYCKIYRHDLLKYLSPVQSPMGCIALYMKDYEGVNDAIAALSPCVAKAEEFDHTGLSQYNVTFTKLLEYLEEHDIELPEEETGFDHYESGLGSIFSMPGGLKENIEFFLGKKLRIDKAEGYSVFNELKLFAESPEDILPGVFDVLNCREGCNIGTACSHSSNVFEINGVMNDNRKKAADGRSKKYFTDLYKKYDTAFDLSRFMMEYDPIDTLFPEITDEDIMDAYMLLNKDSKEKQHVDCGACGSESCRGMARKIALGVNIPENCMIKSMEDARLEHDNKLAVLEKVAFMEQLHQADERMRIMLDKTPICAEFWDKDFNLIDCNQETVRLFNMPSKQEFMDRFNEVVPEFQPDGRRTSETISGNLKKAFEEGYMRFEFFHQLPDGELIPVDVILVRVDFKGESSIAAYLRDLREQKRMTQEINATASKLSTVVYNYPGIICSANKDYEITLFDGLLLGDLLDKDIFFEGQSIKVPLLKPEHDHIRVRMLQTYTAGPQNWSFELKGKILNMITTPVYDEKAEVAGVVGRIDDVSEMTRLQKDLKIALNKAEKAVHASEAAQFTTSAMFGSNPQMNVLFNSKFKMIDCNPAAMKFMGFGTKDETLDGFLDRMIKGMPAFQSNGQPSVSVGEKLVEAFERGFAKFDMEVSMEGATRKLDVEFIRIPYESSFAIVAYLIDMTNIHEREMELMEARELNEIQLAKLNLAVKASKIGLWEMEVNMDDLVNPQNPFIWSDEFRSMLGFSDQTDFPDVLCSWSDRLHPDDKEATLEAFGKHLLDRTGKTPYDVEYRLMRKDGEYAFYRASGETIRDEKGNPLRVAGALVDINETKNILRDTERQKVEAEAANKAKSAFLSTMSHEIRTPLNAILGITEIQLQNESLDSKVKEALGTIYTSGDMLLGIINDILDLSKIDAGKMELVTEKYEIASLISDTAQLNMMRIGSKPIEFELEVDENLPLYVAGDVLRVKQILNNILSNAFKYTDKGTVTLAVSEKAGGGDDDTVILVIDVIDTGQGMTPEQVDKLFDEYSRFNEEYNRSTEGTGLGMAITRNLIRMMRGESTIKSELGKGTSVTLCLPQGRIDSPPLGRESAKNLRKFRTRSSAQMKRVQITREEMPYGKVLIVDDVETNIYVAKGLMTPYKLNIESANSGRAAIQNIQMGKEYDIIFMDHMMPEMDGVEATNTIRGMGYEHPIVALTANAVVGQAEEFLKNGFNDFISKPIDVRQLNAVLNKLIRDRHPEKTAEAKAAADAQNAPKNAETPLVPQADTPSAEPQSGIDPMFAEIFVRDASKSLAVLEAINEKQDSLSDEDLRAFIIHVHGMKSALANIGKTELSAYAFRLETLGRDGDAEIAVYELSSFLDSLKEVIEELKPPVGTDDAAVDEDRDYLREKLLAVKAACEDYDETTADEIISELRKRTWSQATGELLSAIAGHLLHSDFDDIAEAVDKFLEG